MLDIEILKILKNEMNQTDILRSIEAPDKYRPFLIRKLRKMEKQGLIKWKVGDDKRNKIYSRTTKGRKLKEIWD